MILFIEERKRTKHDCFVKQGTRKKSFYLGHVFVLVDDKVQINWCKIQCTVMHVTTGLD